MPEADHGNACDEVQIAPARVVPEPTPLAAHECDIRTRIRREERRLGRDERLNRHAVTSVTPIVARTPCRAARIAAISFGTIPPSNAPPSSLRSASPAPLPATP